MKSIKNELVFYFLFKISAYFQIEKEEMLYIKCDRENVFTIRFFTFGYSFYP